MIEEIIRREGFGQDDVPDLLYVNYKQIDKVGHKFSFPSMQMEEVVRGVDAELADLFEPSWTARSAPASGSWP